MLLNRLSLKWLVYLSSPFTPHLWRVACGSSQARDQGSSRCHSNDPGHCSDNTGSLTHCVTGNSFLGPNLLHMEVPRLGVESELWLLACATATATWDPSHFCNLHHSSQQHWILNQLSKARDQTRILMDTSWIRFHCATMGTPPCPPPFKK